jgi:uncharacterized protein
MDITPIVGEGRQLINGYGGGGFRIAGTAYRGSVLVSFAEVRAATDEIDLLLLGCGASMTFLAEPLRAELRAAGIVTECMDTGAACRTFNVLLAEGRRVAAALIAVE